MKLKYLNYTWFLSLLFCLSCNQSFLDPSNPAAIGSNDVWKDPKLIEMLVNDFYNDRPGYDYSNWLDNITDEARCNYPGFVPNRILVGQWDQVSNPIGFWAYTQVRKTNEFMAKIDSAPIDEPIKKRLKGETRFLRAFLYFDMVKRYGGVPIINTPQSIEDDLEVKRNTLEEVFDFISKELDIAISELPANAPRGRAGKEAAMALKGRALLYFASPLYNTTANNTRWEQAAKANEEIIKLGKFQLYPNLNSLWLDKSQAHNESIFEIQYRLPEKEHSWDAGLRPLRLANNNAGQMSPLQELVDAFPMKNGKSITNPSSGFDPKNPYVGRDDRFYAFIAFNGSKMKGTQTGPPVKEITLETYRGGLDYDSNPLWIIYNTKTAYYTRKATDPENTIYNGDRGSSQSWMELRYAEVLLNYAEAKNEFLGNPDASIYDAVNQVRRRAGITENLQTGSLDKNAMRDLIRNEKYIEFCFEKQRYWDVRRWKLATTLFNNRLYKGAVITKLGNGEFSYQYLPVDPQPNVFTERMYFMPIPQAEIAKNRNLTQNPGWN
ncbi:MAG: RagB/SusD family nutrient uptake outer membrane protein [Cytophagia bacterium]|nr:MAG: RagB/SusD family nutrient uptake outer membrane protein [Cytophagia bacterium]